MPNRPREVDEPTHEDPSDGGGSEGGEHPVAAPLPFAPDSFDYSPLGDSDHHSNA